MADEEVQTADEVRRQHLRNMVDAFVDNNEETAELEFHTAMTSKVRDMMGIEDAMVADELDDETDEEVDGEVEQSEDEEVETDDD